MSTPAATYLLGIYGGRVAVAPPIARWMLGRPEAVCASWLRCRGARFVPLP